MDLTAARPTWQGAARSGMLALPDGERVPVVALVGPETDSTDALNRARRSASMALTLRHPGVLRLIQVAPAGGRVAWCYEDFDGLGLIHVVGSEGAGDMSARAAAELVAQVAEILLALGSPGLHHPGPEPSDVVLSADGRVRIAGFAGPFPASPAMRAPEPGSVEPAAVYRLGVLLATLTSGMPPSAASDRAAHGVLVRRALIRAMARPGPVLSERYGQWIRGMLAWAPAERPPLSAVPAGLRAVAWATGGEGLVDWAARRVPELDAVVLARNSFEDEPLPADEPSDPGELMGLAESGPPPRRAPSERPGPTPLATQELPRLNTPKARRSGFVEDEPTQEATLDPDDSGSRSSVNKRRSAVSMPVEVGPPAEAVSRRPSLPAGFLEPSGPPTDPDAPVARTPVEVTLELRSGPPALWIGLTTGLTILVVVLVAYLLMGDPSAPVPVPRTPGPGLSEGLERFDVPDLPVEPLLDVPAPDVQPDQAPAIDTDTDTSPALEPSQSASPAPIVPARRDWSAGAPDGDTVLFRLASGLSGRIAVRCDGMSATASADSQVRVRDIARGGTCKVSSISPQGAKVSHVVRVRDWATVDCFHGWKDGCLE